MERGLHAKQWWRIRVAAFSVFLSPVVVAQVRVLPLSGLPEYASMDLSPDGKQIVYSGDSGLHIRDVTGGTPHELVGNDGDALAFSPRWSPDGKWVAFTYSDSVPDERLYLKSLAGGKPQFVARLCTRGGAEFAWTSDSTALIVPLPRPGDDTDPPCRLSVFNVSTGKVSRFLTLGQSPAVSADGKTMAFVRDHEIRMLPLSPDLGVANRETVVAREPRAIGVPAWTKDGTALVYSIWGECEEVHRVAARAGAIPTQIKDIPAGIRLSGSANKSQAVLGYRSDETVTSYTLDLQASDPRFVAGPEPTGAHLPARSPDGRRIAYSACSMGASEILTARADGSEVRVLVNRQEAPVSGPIWSPDGRSVAFTVQPGSLVGHGDSTEWLFVIPASGGKPKRLLPSFYSVFAPWWSRDSQTIVFSGAKDVSHPFPEYLWSVRLSDQKLTQLTTRGCGQARPSPDGGSVYCYYYYFRPHIYRVLTTGEEEADLPGNVQPAPFLAGSKYLYFVTKSNVLLRYDPRDGSTQEIAVTPGNSRLASLSPDERVITVRTRSTNSREPVMITSLR